MSQLIATFGLKEDILSKWFLIVSLCLKYTVKFTVPSFGLYQLFIPGFINPHLVD